MNKIEWSTKVKTSGHNKGAKTNLNWKMQQSSLKIKAE
ncbi:hypothetical protein FM107_16320 [Sphingobacterium sp. JB170]|nr:hypothetical protein FM107_16320 [Sphingobacterium sp. JB170]